MSTHTCTFCPRPATTTTWQEHYAHGVTHVPVCDFCAAVALEYGGRNIQPVIVLPADHIHTCDHCGARAIALVWQDGVDPDGHSGWYYGPDCGRCVEFTMPA